MAINLSNVQLSINNDVVGVQPNTVSFTEGLGSQVVRAESIGAGQVNQVYSENVEDKFSTVKFSILPHIPNIEKARGWKVNRNQNVIEISGQTADGEILSRTITQAALINDYEVNIGSDADIALEFMGNSAV
jgi:hypothetical protein